MNAAELRSNDPSGDAVVPHTPSPVDTLIALDAETAMLVRVAAVLAGGTEGEVRRLLTEAEQDVRALWIEEVILQTYLFAGFPRALNGMREWRRITGRPAPAIDLHAIDDHTAQQLRGAATCAVVYGAWYDRLRDHIAALHPALDRWMIEEGYGKVLSRGALDLGRRELCIVAACAISRQDRQLHAHLHGALNAGVSAPVIAAALDVLAPMLHTEDHERYGALWARVQGTPGTD
ncbi:MAG: hypothetical protein RLZZ621_1763 [Gemmatimonadota bacterium]